jgi:two-component system sensor histidine kinase RpfC
MPSPAVDAAAGSPVNVIAFDDPFLRHRARVKSMRLLIGDDQPANLLVLRRMLEKAGHDAVLVDDGEAALQALEQEEFDAVVIDLHMPKISGIDVIKQARVMEAGRRHTPFIVLSADATADTIRSSEQAGAKAFLTKPVAARPLLDALAEIATGEPMVAAVSVPQGNVDDGVISRNTLDEWREMRLGPDFAKLFVSECVRDATRCIADLDQHAANSNWDRFRDTCHALKGVASNVGAARLAAGASEAMQLANWQLTGQWRARTRDLRERLDAARTALHHEIALGSADAGQGDSN